MSSDAGQSQTRIVIASDPLAVRQALQVVFARLMAGRMAADACDSAQIVLAEVLNNIVEHAYAQGPGEIEVTITQTPTGLTCRIIDAGLPLPGGTVPPAPLVALNGGGDVSEGGYGWHLIRTLCQDLRYSREDGRNFLTFRITSQQYPH